MTLRLIFLVYPMFMILTFFAIASTVCVLVGRLKAYAPPVRRLDAALGLCAVGGVLALLLSGYPGTALPPLVGVGLGLVAADRRADEPY